MLTNPVCAQVSPKGTGNAANDYISIYQKYLSGLKNTRCSMYPSCSSYAKMVFSDYPFLVAMVKTADRLTRCSHDLSFYPTSHVYDFVTAVDYPESRTIPNGVVYHLPTLVSSESIQIKDSLDHNIQFIKILINKQSFSSALLEIERVFYCYPEVVETKPDLYIDKMKCYEGLKQYSKAILEYETSFPQVIKNSYKVLYTLAHLYNLLGDSKNAIDCFEKSSRCLPAQESVTPFGELALLYANANKFDNSKDAFYRKFLIDENTSAYESSIKVLEQLQNTRYKNPTLAMTMSIIPGMGYLYTKQPQNALAALFINGVLAYATYTSFKNKNYGVGGILGALNLSFYIGNMSGSRNSAIRYNNTIKNNSMNVLREINPYIN